MKQLKEDYDGDVLVSGSATLVNALRAEGLVDEYRLMVHPIIAGGGKRLFDGRAPGTTLQLLATRQVGPDVTVLTYRPAELVNPSYHGS